LDKQIHREEYDISGKEEESGAQGVYRRKREISPVTGLESPRGFQKFKVPRLHDNGTGWW
jgi:hypothetical protein